MGVSANNGSIRFLYGTVPGRWLLRLIMKTRADRLAVRFLWSASSRPMVGSYVRKHDLPLTREQYRSFRSFRDFFARVRPDVVIDREGSHLISPCDGYLSVFPIREGSSFAIKSSYYRIEDLLQDAELAKNYEGGDCLIFRLCASDYHHYCYIDDCYQGQNHYIPGALHSVQPLACEKFPVYTLNRRSWCLMTTEHFGPVVQTEIGALIVGGIANERENARVRRGSEKGHFELSGSTIVLLFEPGRIALLPELAPLLADGQEVRVLQGMQIGTVKEEQMAC